MSFVVISAPSCPHFRAVLPVRIYPNMALWWANWKLTCGIKVEDLFVWGEICDLWFGVVLRKFFLHDSHENGMSGKKSYDTNNYTEWSWVSSPGLEFFSREPAGFVHFFGQNSRFFQTIFLFSRLKVTVRFFMAQEEITVLTMKMVKKNQFQLFSS